MLYLFTNPFLWESLFTVAALSVLHSSQGAGNIRILKVDTFRRGAF